jgi:hypothetical protein
MSVKIKGLDQALKDLGNQEDKVIQAVIDVLTETADGINDDATRGATQAVLSFRQDFPPDSFPGRDLNFSQRIDRVVEQKGLVHKVGINVADKVFEIEAWLEFGTGLSAQEILSRPEYTSEIRAIAETFKRNGRGTIKGYPYLFPAFFRRTANIVQEIESEIEKATK